MGHISKSQKGPPQPKHRTDEQKTHALTPATHPDQMNHVRKQSGYRSGTNDLPTQSYHRLLRYRSASHALTPGTNPRHMNVPCFQNQRTSGTKVKRTLSRPPHMRFRPETSGLKPATIRHRTRIGRFQMNYAGNNSNSSRSLFSCLKLTLYFEKAHFLGSNSFLSLSLYTFFLRPLNNGQVS